MVQLKIHEMAEHERPREKLAAHGAPALSDAELIAILLRTGVSGANAIDVARELLEKYGSLTGLSRCSVDELSKIKGVKLTKAVQLVAAFGLGDRLARERWVKQKVDSPELANELVGLQQRARAADGAAGAHDCERGNDPLRRIRRIDRKNTSRARAARPQRGANRDDAGVELAIADSAPGDAVDQRNLIGATCGSVCNQAREGPKWRNIDVISDPDTAGHGVLPLPTRHGRSPQLLTKPITHDGNGR